jgi:hypothetical protein
MLIKHGYVSPVKEEDVIEAARGVEHISRKRPAAGLRVIVCLRPDRGRTLIASRRGETACIELLSSAILWLARLGRAG